ncbi:MAG TPA: sigma-54-dependent Fis family transcriptional regulator [Burkholderiaceae bacterium]|nr:sigma-54-dependent Fis family transcriptional regulator [Burkholderiaceae bacterium]
MGSGVPRDSFSRPENERRIKASWEKFLSGEGPPSNALRCLIDDSWRRCLTDRVDPSRHQAPPPLDQSRIALLRKRHARLVDASTPLMAQARDFLSQTGTVMILTDPDGTILGVEGDPKMRQPLEGVRLLPGCNWTEAAVGTNAIGTALALGQPVQIHAAEHFCEGIQQWTCSATIIRDPMDQSILGVIDVSGLSRSYSRHSLALVVTMADRIENRLARLEMESRFRLLEQCMPKLSPAAAAGVIVFDRRGNLVKANENAADALAKQGISFELNAGARIPALATSEGVGEGAKTAESLPAWMQPDWVQPIVERRELLGTVVSIPLPRRRVSSAQVADDDPVAAKGFERIVGTTAALQEALHKARHLARSHVPVLLLGETGVGKELFARGIHDSGASSDGPFVALNCGGLSRELLTSELFGYAEGAFTGSRRGGMIGKIEAANGGTLFLDEIGEMPLDLQPHFLRVLEEGEIYRVGETAPRKVRFRLIAATNRDLRSEVAAGRFRMDLFYRIAVTSIRLPALRDRREDIRLLVDSILAALCARHAVAVPSVDEQVFAALERYDWPGNVRELRNVIESMLLLAVEGKITVADLPAEVSGTLSETLRGTLGAAAPSRVPSTVSESTLESAEQAQIRGAIRSSQGNLTLAAKTLGIAKSTLYLKLKKYDMQDALAGFRDPRF